MKDTDIVIFLSILQLRPSPSLERFILSFYFPRLRNLGKCVSHMSYRIPSRSTGTFLRVLYLYGTLQYRSRKLSYGLQVWYRSECYLCSYIGYAVVALFFTVLYCIVLYGLWALYTGTTL
jgi:hypothetical protein